MLVHVHVCVLAHVYFHTFMYTCMNTHVHVSWQAYDGQRITLWNPFSFFIFMKVLGIIFKLLGLHGRHFMHSAQPFANPQLSSLKLF